MIVDPEKIEKILTLEPPRTLRQLRGFIGMMSYYRKYIKDFSRIVAPLVELVKKRVEYKWGARY